MTPARTPIVVLLTGLVAVACPPLADDTDTDTDTDVDTDTAADTSLTIEVVEDGDAYVGVPVVFHDETGMALDTVTTGADGVASVQDFPAGGGVSVVLSGENEIITRMGLQPGDAWSLDPVSPSTELLAEVPQSRADADDYRLIDCLGFRGFDPESSATTEAYVPPVCERSDGSTTLAVTARDEEQGLVAWSITEAQARPDATVTFPEWETELEEIEVVMDGTRSGGQPLVQLINGTDGIRLGVDSADVDDGGDSVMLHAVPALPETLVRAGFDRDESGLGVRFSTVVRTRGFGTSRPSQVRFDLDSEMWPAVTDTGVLPETRELTWDADGPLTGAEMVFASIPWNDESGQRWDWSYEGPLQDAAGSHVLPELPEVALSDDPGELPDGATVWIVRHSQLDFEDLRLEPYPAQLWLLSNAGSDTFEYDLAYALGN